VLWQQKEKSGKLVWQQSQGTLERVCRYIDIESSQTYAANNFDKLLQRAERQRVMLISDTAGMIKSTVQSCIIISFTQNIKHICKFSSQ